MYDERASKRAGGGQIFRLNSIRESADLTLGERKKKHRHHEFRVLPELLSQRSEHSLSSEPAALHTSDGNAGSPSPQEFKGQTPQTRKRERADSERPTGKAGSKFKFPFLDGVILFYYPQPAKFNS
ncbi:hypothetical protein F5888DRAFT_1632614 [Russula emetica]|nr:hypothetical protein F5888DRAFT_1632614 [Russula emetica]